MRVILTLGIVLSLLVTSAYAEETSDKKVDINPVEQKKKNIEICTHNLKTIGKAIQAYHEEHGDYPEWLSDLLPKHLADANVLICPADKNGGKSIHPYTIDPKKSVSYDYQLVPKLRKGVMDTQVLFGDATPLVRCWHHSKERGLRLLNLSMAYKVYRASQRWYNSVNSIVKIYGSVEAAIDTLEVGFQKMPDNGRFFSVYPILLGLYIKAERQEDAENLINRYKALVKPDNFWHNSILGDMYKKMNRHEEELQLYEELEKRLPKNRFLLEKLAEIHKKQGNAELALEYRKKYVPGLAFLGEMVPDFSATDLEGKPISIEAYRGKVVLVDFWAVWCGPCVADMPNVKKVYEKYKDKGFDVIGISLDNDEKQLRDFLKKNDIPWRQVYSGKGWDSPVSRQYGIYSIPSVWLIDKDGKLISNNARGEKLENMVAEALKDKLAD